MAFLVVLKRFEVWLLLAVVVGLVAFALSPETATTGAGPDPATSATSATSASAAATTAGTETGGGSDPGSAVAADNEDDADPLVVSRVAVLASGGGAIVETTLSGRAPNARDLVLDEASVAATSDSGEPVALFFEPFREPGAIAAEGDSAATLRWWLPRGPEALWIEVGGRRLRAELP